MYDEVWDSGKVFGCNCDEGFFGTLHKKPRRTSRPPLSSGLASFWSRFPG